MADHQTEPDPYSEVKTATSCVTEETGRTAAYRIWVRFDPPLWAYLGPVDGLGGPDGRRDVRTEHGAWCFPPDGGCVFSAAENFRVSTDELWTHFRAENVLAAVRADPLTAAGEPEPLANGEVRVRWSAVEDGEIVEGLLVYGAEDRLLRSMERLAHSLDSEKLRARTTWEFRYNEPIPEEVMAVPPPGAPVRVAE